MTRIFFFLAVLILCPQPEVSAIAQGNSAQQLLSTPDRRTDNDTVERETRKLFQLVQEGIQGGRLNLFSQDLSPQVIMNLGGSESGYYSSSQAYYLLEEHFRERKVIEVALDVIHASDPTPYATGTLTYMMKGSRQKAQIYVSLSQSGARWTISQITIY